MDKQAQESTKKIESCLKRGDTFEAYNLADEFKNVFPENVRILQLYALSLARLGSTEKARNCLEDLYNKNPDDSETIGILGRVYKDILKKSGDADYAYLSRDTYLKGFNHLKEYYLGINAATMSYILGEKDKAEKIARDVIDIIDKTENKDFWMLATLGEAYLITNDLSKATDYYCQAYKKAEGNYGNLNSSYQQLCFIAKYTEVPGELLKIFKPAGIITFSGHMIDSPNRKKPRFPESLTEAVKKEISRVLDELNAGIGYCSAACGSDILFIEAMLERGAEVNVFLPFCKEDFIKTSVSYAGREWEDRFNRILESVNVKYVTDEGYYGDDDLFSVLNNVIMGMSIIRSNILLTEPVFLAVVEQNELEGIKLGGTEDLLKKWPYRENIRIIDPGKLKSTQKKIKTALKKPKVNEYSLGQIPEGLTRSVNCILFADIVGFEKIQEEFNPDFMYKLFRAVSEQMEFLDKKPKVFNSWGNAICVIYDRTKDIIEFALMLKEIVLNKDWELENFEGELSIRIAMHTGPCFISIDPITNRWNAYGTHINRTACMEAITVPGCIYASEQFTAQMVIETGNLYRYEYVGLQKLSKEYGSHIVYHISRRDDFSFMISDYKREQKLKSTDDSSRDEAQVIRSLQTDMLAQLKSDAQEKEDKEDTFEWLILYMTEEKFDKGHVLFKKGEKADKIYYIDSGIIRLKEIDIIVKEGELIGETGIFSPIHTRTASAICETDIAAHTIAQDKMIDLVYKKPSLLFDLIQLSIKRFTVNLARSLEEKEMIKSELKIAHAIQNSMLPTVFPDRGEFDIFATMEAAKEVGGDFYDFFFINENKFCIVIGDVSGKGVPASLFMVISKTLLKMASMNDIPPHEVLSSVNEMLYPDNNECMFVTVFHAILNIETGELQYANGGHNPPLISTEGENFKFLNPKKSCVLGIMQNINFVTETINLKKGDVIYLYTDGVNEAMNSNSDQYSNERLNQTLIKLKGSSVNEVIDRVREDIKNFVQDSPQSDDMTMLVLKYNG